MFELFRSHKRLTPRKQPTHLCDHVAWQSGPEADDYFWPRTGTIEATSVGEHLELKRDIDPRLDRNTPGGLDNQLTVFATPESVVHAAYSAQLEKHIRSLNPCDYDVVIDVTHFISPSQQRRRQAFDVECVNKSDKQSFQSPIYRGCCVDHVTVEKPWFATSGSAPIDEEFKTVQKRSPISSVSKEFDYMHDRKRKSCMRIPEIDESEAAEISDDDNLHTTGDIVSGGNRVPFPANTDGCQLTGTHGDGQVVATGSKTCPMHHRALHAGEESGTCMSSLSKQSCECSNIMDQHQSACRNDSSLFALCNSCRTNGVLNG